MNQTLIDLKVLDNKKKKKNWDETQNFCCMINRRRVFERFFYLYLLEVESFFPSIFSKVLLTIVLDPKRLSDLSKTTKIYSEIPIFIYLPFSFKFRLIQSCPKEKFNLICFLQLYFKLSQLCTNGKHIFLPKLY